MLIRINSVDIIFTFSAAVGFYREATHMISRVNVGARSVGKDKNKAGVANGPRQTSRCCRAFDVFYLLNKIDWSIGGFFLLIKKSKLV